MGDGFWQTLLLLYLIFRTGFWTLDEMCYGMWVLPRFTNLISDGCSMLWFHPCSFCLDTNEPASFLPTPTHLRLSRPPGLCLISLCLSLEFLPHSKLSSDIISAGKLLLLLHLLWSNGSLWIIYPRYMIYDRHIRYSTHLFISLFLTLVQDFLTERILFYEVMIVNRFQ